MQPAELHTHVIDGTLCLNLQAQKNSLQQMWKSGLSTESLLEQTKQTYKETTETHQ